MSWDKHYVDDPIFEQQLPIAFPVSDWFPIYFRFRLVVHRNRLQFPPQSSQARQVSIHQRPKGHFRLKYLKQGLTIGLCGINQLVI